MASIVIPSSSPPLRISAADSKARTPPQHERDFVPDSQSSDSLPSLSKLLRPPGDTRLRTGSRAETVPEDAVPGFQSASRLLQFRLLDLCDQSTEQEETGKVRGKVAGKASKPRARAKKGSAVHEITRAVARDLVDQDGPAKKLKPQSLPQLGAGKNRRTKKRKSTESREEPPEVVSVHFKASVTESTSATDGAVKEAATKSCKRRKVAVKNNGIAPCTSTKHAKKAAFKRETEKSSAHFATGNPSAELPEDLPILEINDPTTNVQPPQKEAVIIEAAPQPSTFCEDPAIYEIPSSPARTVKDLKSAKVLQLQPAIKRRRSWTPVKDGPQLISIEKDSTDPECPHMIADGMLTSVSSESHQRGLSPTLGFEHLQKQFGFNAGNTVSQTLSIMESQASAPVIGHAPRKVEFIPHCPGVLTEPAITADALMTAGVTKAKRTSPKKAFRSITDRAIEAYRPVAAPDTSRLSPHFAPVFEQPKSKASSPARMDTTRMEQLKPRIPKKRKDVPSKSKKSAAKTKAGAVQDPKILSPEQHQARLARQDVMFGTSSQLRTDASPRFIRSMQQACRESLDALPEESHRSTAPIKLGLTGAKRRVAGKMWQQAHCVDDEGFHVLHDNGYAAADEITVSPCLNQMVSREQLALAERFVKSNDAELGSIVDQAPRSEKGSLSKSEISPVNPGTARDTDGGADDGFLDIHAVEQALDDGRNGQSAPEHLPTSLRIGTARIVSSKSPTPPSHQPVLQSNVPLFRQPVVDTSTASPTRVALQALSTNAKPPDRSRATSLPGKPGSISTSESAQGALKRGRGRPKKFAAEESPAAPPKPRGRPRKEQLQANPNDPPKRRGRPPKSGASLISTPHKASKDVKLDSEGFQKIDDIEDSEPDLTPPTPSRRGRPSSSPPILPLTGAAEDKDPTGKKRTSTHVMNATHPRWPALQAKLFPEIAAAIKDAPPTHDTKRLTWHEKMLLYDPIVLEDLTAWLNQQGLKVEGKDGEAAELSEWMVQRWCESQSIICLWREGLRGGVRVRY